eukprot:scaffold317102_cov37-Tisochrysis_lutea.AAC.1
MHMIHGFGAAGAVIGAVAGVMVGTLIVRRRRNNRALALSGEGPWEWIESVSYRRVSHCEWHHFGLRVRFYAKKRAAEHASRNPVFDLRPAERLNAPA